MLFRSRVKAVDTRPIFHVMMDFYVYKFNLIAGVGPKRPFGSFSEFGNHKKIFPSLARNVGLVTHPAIEDGGWHFSYMDNTDGERVLKKYHSFAHATDHGRGLNGGRYADASTTDQALTILQRDFEPRMVDISADTHPKYMVNNLDKFKDYIFKP